MWFDVSFYLYGLCLLNLLLLLCGSVCGPVSRGGSGRLFLHVLEDFLGRVFGQGRRRRVLGGKLQVNSHLVSSKLLLVDKDHVALFARLEAFVDRFDVVEKVIAPFKRFVATLAVEYPLAVNGLCKTSSLYKKSFTHILENIIYLYVLFKGPLVRQ